MGEKSGRVLRQGVEVVACGRHWREGTSDRVRRRACVVPCGRVRVSSGESCVSFRSGTDGPDCARRRRVCIGRWSPWMGPRSCPTNGCFGGLGDVQRPRRCESQRRGSGPCSGSGPSDGGARRVHPRRDHRVVCESGAVHRARGGGVRPLPRIGRQDSLAARNG